MLRQDSNHFLLPQCKDIHILIQGRNEVYWVCNCGIWGLEREVKDPLTGVLEPFKYVQPY